MCSATNHKPSWKLLLFSFSYDESYSINDKWHLAFLYEMEDVLHQRPDRRASSESWSDDDGVHSRELRKDRSRCHSRVYNQVGRVPFNDWSCILRAEHVDQVGTESSNRRGGKERSTGVLERSTDHSYLATIALKRKS